MSQEFTRPRGDCATCGREVGLRNDGTTRTHNRGDGIWGHCPGSHGAAYLSETAGVATMTPASAVAALNALAVDDPEAAHGRADEILLAALPPALRDAYASLEQRAPWWGAA